MQDAGTAIRSVVFDLEGTLVDFQWRLAEAEAELRQAFAAQGYDTAGNYAQLWNAAAGIAHERNELEALRRTLGPMYDRWDADALTRWSLRADVVKLFDELAGRGIPMALVSNIGRIALDALLARFDLQNRLAPTISRDEVIRMKPDAEGVLRALAEIGARPEDSLFVGDSRTDVRAARNVGMPVAIIRGGECVEADFADDPPDHFITGLMEVATLVV